MGFNVKQSWKASDIRHRTHPWGWQLDDNSFASWGQTKICKCVFLLRNNLSKPGRLSGRWRANHHLDGLVLEPKQEFQFHHEFENEGCFSSPWSFLPLDFDNRFQRLEGPFSLKKDAKMLPSAELTFQECDSNVTTRRCGKGTQFPNANSFLFPKKWCHAFWSWR